MGDKDQPRSQKPANGPVKEVPLGVVRLMKHITVDEFGSRSGDKPKPSEGSGKSTK